METDPFDDIDVETLVAFEGFDYKLSAGTSGLQINIRTCPACGSDQWKVYLNADTGFGNCFKCNIGYSKFKFLKIARGFNWPSEVYKYIENNATTFTYRPKKKKSTNIKINKDWKLPINSRIENDDDLLDYLKKRKIDLKLAKRFDLRTCEAGFYTYEDFGGKKKAVDFSKRIIIPVRDIDGKLVTFQGRDYSEKSTLRYLFPNLLPSSGSYIYNADYALKNNFKKIVLNEGVFDVYGTTQALESDVTFNEYCACGTFGKHLGIAATNLEAKDQLSDLFRLRANGLEEIVILWDGEIKAIEAAMNTAIALENFGFKNVKVGKLSNDLDPSDATKEQILTAIKNAEKVTKLSLVRYRMLNV